VLSFVDSADGRYRSLLSINCISLYRLNDSKWRAMCTRFETTRGELITGYMTRAMQKIKTVSPRIRNILRITIRKLTLCNPPRTCSCSIYLNNKPGIVTDTLFWLFIQRTPTNIRISFISLETIISGLHLCRSWYKNITSFAFT